MSSNRLLDMLKSATSPPPPTYPQEPTSHQSTPPAASAQSGNSPREPSPAPPPPSLQAVSLSELFASITSPPASAPKQTSSATDQKAKLLGMLNSITPSGGDQSMGKANGGRESSDRRVSSGSQQSSRPLPTPKSPQAASQGLPGSRLDSLPTTLAEPVINHSTSPQPEHVPSAPPLSGSASPFASEVPPPVTSTPSSTLKSPVVASNPPPPKKSMFDFVSPFSAFDNPKPSPKADKKSETTVQSSIVNGGSPQPTKINTPPISAPKAPTSIVAAQETRARQASNVSSSGAPSGSGSSKDLGLPYLLAKVVEKGTQGRGPQQMGKQGVTVDLSQPNLDSLVNAPEAAQIIPTTILRTDNLGFSKGRSVGITSNWLAYALTKGRVRLIHAASGARLVLQLPPRSTQGFIVDLAVSGDLVAIIGPDHSVTVFKVPDEWTKDDPPIDMVVHITGSRGGESADADLGDVNQIEWVERVKGDRQLAIGGPGGVVIVNLDALKGRDEVSTADLARENKVLATEGALISFCLNASHQAIGLISENGTFTLYNMSNLLRVWNRKLPDSPSGQSPSSIQFCESNLVIGRGNNTSFDLVQITIEPAVLSTIAFTVPPSSPSSLHFCQAVYDHSRTILWIAPFARGSLFGFKYNLKGVPPAKAAELPAAFDKYAEYPLESVLSLVLGPESREGNAEMFFATPNGFSQVQVDKAVCDALTSPAESQPKPPTGVKHVPMPDVKRGTKGSVGTKTPSKQTQSPAIKSEPLWDAPAEKLASSQSEPAKKDKDVSLEPFKADASVSEEISKALKRSESTLQNNFKQLLANQLGPISTRLDSFASGELAEEIGAKVEKQIKGSITSVLQQEIKKSVLPALNTTIQNEVRSATASTVPAALGTALQSLPRDLERSLAPVFQRIVANVVQTSVDRAVQDALTTSLLPSMTAASARLADQLKSDFKSEMVQMRKDLSPPRAEPQLSHEPLLRSLAASIAEMQQQIAVLSAARSHGADHHTAPAGPAPPIGAGAGLPPVNPSAGPQGQSQFFVPPLNQVQQPAPSLQQTASQLEDAFLAALGAQSSGATVQLMNEYWVRTEGILPNPPGRSPLSQAVLLTLFHRAAVAVSELSPFDTSFTRLANWLRRVALLLEPRNPETASFYPRVLPVVQGIINNTIGMLQQRYPNEVDNVRLLRSVLEIVNK